MNKILTIKQLNNYIKGVFEDEIILHDVTVCGEISEFKIIGNNTFIVLKDEDSVLSCYRFGTYENLPIGTKVRISGKVTFYSGSGRVSLNIRKIENVGEGEQRLALLLLKKKLEEEGLCTGRPLPELIRKVALITSAEGAVLHDFETVIQESDFKPEISIYPVRVQGVDAVNTLLKALETANKTDADLIVIARGGGSQSDLQCFDSEKLARAVNASMIPVLSAIGHEVDFSLCDFCAAARAGTPSIAAQIVAEINRKAANKLYEITGKMKAAISSDFVNAFLKLSDRADKMYRYSVSVTDKLKNRVLKCCISLIRHRDVEIRENTVRNLCGKLIQNIGNNYSKAEKALSESSLQLDYLSPLKVIGQGYGKINKDGKEINEVSEMKKGDCINIIMRDGNADAEIQSIYRRLKK